jgi:hypothetical protein
MERPRADNHPAGIKLDRLERLLALAAIVLLGTVVGGCSNTSKSTTSASQAVAETTTTKTNPEQEHIQDNAPYDSDHDTDLTHPDEDDNGKPAAPDMDNDGDNETKQFPYDSDDKSTLAFGHPAGAADRKQITALVRRYYPVAVAADGATACSLLSATYAAAVPQDLGTSPPGPSFAKGTTCATSVTNYLRHYHPELAARFPKLKISLIRVRGPQGMAILSFPKAEREMNLVREGHTWRMLSLFDAELT